MLKMNKKSQKNKLIYQKFEISKKITKSIAENLNYSKITRWNSAKTLYFFPFNASLTRLIFKCILKGSKAGLNSFYKYSRHAFLKLVRFGNIHGLYKANW
jgi:ribosomal protein S14